MTLCYVVCAIVETRLDSRNGKRWMIERMFAWMGMLYRNAKNYDTVKGSNCRFSCAVCY